MTQSNNRSKGKKNRARKSNLKTRQPLPTKSLLINEMPEAGPRQCQKNPVAGGGQVACEKHAACGTLDEGSIDTNSSRLPAGSTNITEPIVNVSPKDDSRGMHPTDGCDCRTVKSVEKQADSDSIASIDDDEDIYSGIGQAMSEECQDINEDPVINHHQSTKGALDITAPTSSTAPVDSHSSREPWQSWSKDKKLGPVSI